MWNFCDQPYTLIAFSIILALIVSTVKGFVSEKYQNKLWLIPIFTLALAFALEFLVTTDTEKIKATIKTCVKTVQDEQPQEFEKIISPDYSDTRHNTKANLVNNFTAALRYPLIDKAFHQITDLQIKDVKAQANVHVKMLFEKDSYAGQLIPGTTCTVRITLKKNSDGNWLINGTEITKFHSQDATWSSVPYRTF